MTDLLTVEQVAVRLLVSPRTVRRWIANGSLHAIRLPSGSVRISEVALAQALRTFGREDER
ncbi:helix-turn-helix domain-containing protein [Humibacter albus]|uniref:helix-turn-helix domain-containing protein n=1 Tax=Humibacter albus TaxID=427754 RepID=UPI00052532AF